MQLPRREPTVADAKQTQPFIADAKQTQPFIAVREARECKSNKSLQIRQKSLMRSTKICKILNRFVGFLREAHSI